MTPKMEELYGRAWRETAAREGYVKKHPAKANAGESWNFTDKKDRRLQKLWTCMGNKEWTNTAVAEQILFTSFNNARHALDRLLIDGRIETKIVLHNKRNRKIYKRIEKNESD